AGCLSREAHPNVYDTGIHLIGIIFCSVTWDRVNKANIAELARVQTGNTCWEFYCLEGPDRHGDDSLSIFSNETSVGKPVPRPEACHSKDEANSYACSTTPSVKRSLTASQTKFTGWLTGAWGSRVSWFPTVLWGNCLWFTHLLVITARSQLEFSVCISNFPQELLRPSSSPTHLEHSDGAFMVDKEDMASSIETRTPKARTLLTSTSLSARSYFPSPLPSDFRDA
ncbi:hypothetical protein U0070_016634, partial [Myodes glareolus]